MELSQDEAGQYQTIGPESPARALNLDEKQSRGHSQAGDEHDTHMDWDWCTSCFRRDVATGISANLAKPTERRKATSLRATQQYPGAHKTDWRLWDQDELARSGDDGARRSFLAGRGCHLNFGANSVHAPWRSLTPATRGSSCPPHTSPSGTTPAAP